VHDNRRQRARAAVLVATIPRVAGAILFVRRAAQPMVAAKFVDLPRTICGADGKTPECRLQRLKQIPPAAIASVGSSGRFENLSIAAISLNKKSRMKNDSDRRVRENSSAARTDSGAREGRLLVSL
jgi:hypothetical protein